MGENLSNPHDAYFRAELSQAEAVVGLFARVGPNAKETTVAYFEGIRAELMEELRAQPENEFLVKGQAEIVLEQLSFRFGAVSDRVRQVVRAASSAELREFARRMFTATSVDEVIAG
ncbi:hypothetical protein [Nocardia aurantia]|uniref:Uncharacterized protein n=1 Tax=Nocardia aurantia TaxID=2585199 RepID=A0A7K0DIP8_9NOCA|nr:hypothetical protein [Nocardia aurantia]MQY25675.1 hypothetical protein [Nocardia aurantia]